MFSCSLKSPKLFLEMLLQLGQQLGQPHIAINLQLQPAGLTQLYGQCVTALRLQLLLDLCGLKELEIVTLFSCLTVEPGLLLRPLGFSFGQADNEKYS